MAAASRRGKRAGSILLHTGRRAFTACRSCRLLFSVNISALLRFGGGESGGPSRCLHFVRHFWRKNGRSGPAGAAPMGRRWRVVLCAGICCFRARRGRGVRRWTCIAVRDAGVARRDGMFRTSRSRLSVIVAIANVYIYAVCLCLRQFMKISRYHTPERHFCRALRCLNGLPASISGGVLVPRMRWLWRLPQLPLPR